LLVATEIAMAEILDILNPPRRHRSYPRVVKRHFAKYHNIKRVHHRGRRYSEPPKIHIYAVRA
jgi:hypothetical protein